MANLGLGIAIKPNEVELEEQDMRIRLGLIIGIAIAALAIWWAVDSSRIRSYTGTEVAIGIGSGSVAIRNLSETNVPVALTSMGTRGTFTIASGDPAFAGASARQGSGRTATHTIMLDVPPGEHEFRVSRGSNVSLYYNGPATVDVIVNPQSEGEARTTIIGAIVGVLLGLYLASRSLGHPWLRRGRQDDDLSDPDYLKAGHPETGPRY